MSCTPKLSNTCGIMQYATCVYYEITVPAFSSLIDEECYTVEEALADLYQLMGGIKEEIDLSALTDNGLEYTLEDGKILVKNALSDHAEAIVKLQESVSGILKGYDGNVDITTWGLDTECLVESCGEPITDLKKLLQVLITKACV